MSTADNLYGDFWLPESAGSRRQGTLDLTKGTAPSLSTQGALTSMMSVPEKKTGPDGSFCVQSHFDPDRTPRTVYGKADDGMPLTLLETQNLGYAGGLLPHEQKERWSASHVILGAHLSGRDHRFTGVRVRLQAVHGALSATRAPSWGSPVPLASGGVLSLDEMAEETWLVLEGLPSASLRGLDRTYLRPLSSLLSLASGEILGLLGLEVSQEESAPWLRVHSGSHRAADLSWPNQALLERSDVAPEAVARWLDRVETLGPLPPVVVNGLRGPVSLESRVLELTTLAEGLHRRLQPDAQRYPKETGDAIRKAAVHAAATVEDTSADVVKGLLRFVHEPGYAWRLSELARMAEPLAPGVTGKTNRWKTLVYAARNDYAHRTRAGWLDEEDVDRYLTVALSMQWLLRALMLAEAGFPSELLARRMNAHDPFSLFLEQARTWQPTIYE